MPIVLENLLYHRLYLIWPEFKSMDDRVAVMSCLLFVNFLSVDQWETRLITPPCLLHPSTPRLKLQSLVGPSVTLYRWGNSCVSTSEHTNAVWNLHQQISSFRRYKKIFIRGSSITMFVNTNRNLLIFNNKLHHGRQSPTLVKYCNLS